MPPPGLELLWRNWPQIQALCRRDKQFRDAFFSLICNHCFCLQDWQRKHERDMGTCKPTRSPAAKAALRFLGSVYLKCLMRKEPLPGLTRKALRLCQCACAPAKDNPYMKDMPFPRTTLSGCLR